MANIFYRGQFDAYKVTSLSKSLEAITESYTFDSSYHQTKTKVFLSHKHDDLDDLKGVIGLLREKFNVDVYIDSKDKTMPKTTSGVTATRIKERIKKCDKFILLATDGAIESKWCNWELGFGDAVKSENKNIALFPMCDDKNKSYLYKGNEYMDIYPYIRFEDGLSKYSDGSYIERGYYIVEKRDGTNYFTKLSSWFSNRG